MQRIKALNYYQIGVLVVVLVMVLVFAVVYPVTILFRGGVLDLGDMYWLYNEDGTPESLGITYVTSDDVERDQYGNAIDRMKPSVSTIYELLHGPELTHKGEPLAWFMAAFLCVLNVLTVAALAIFLTGLQ